MRSLAWYTGEESVSFGLWENGVLACLCIFWTHRRPRDQIIWRIHEHEAILMEILTLEKFRGQGYAPVLLQYAVQEMKCNRFKSLYAWIWHSNTASVRAFEKAGWRYIAFVIEILPFNTRKILRFQWNKS